MSTTTSSSRQPCGCSGSAMPKGPSDCGCGCGGHGNCQCKAGGAGACAACDDLSSSAYVRPRFFAGQLLTESDLQQALDYMLAKNRLHNRHFLGEGVVCGLEVHCDDCDGQGVIVNPGYALDCCGNDIVVPCAVTLSVRTLIQQLRDRNARDCSDPCPPPRKCGQDDGTPKDHDAADKKTDQTKPQTRCYDLYLVYCESQADPVSPYDTGDECSDGCEFTRVHEGFRFELRCPIDSGEENLLCRLLEAHLSTQQIDPENDLDLIGGEKLKYGEAQRKLLLSIRDRFLDKLDDDASLTFCRLRKRVTNIPIPDAITVARDAAGERREESEIEARATEASLQAALASAKSISIALKDYKREKYCLALLPPCPPCDYPAVRIARIDMNECRAIHICNTTRKTVMTAPNLRYWLPIPILARELERLCCDDCEGSGEKNPIAMACRVTLPKEQSSWDAVIDALSHDVASTLPAKGAFRTTQTIFDALFEAVTAPSDASDPVNPGDRPPGVPDSEKISPGNRDAAVPNSDTTSEGNRGAAVTELLKADLGERRESAHKKPRKQNPPKANPRGNPNE